MVNLRTRSKARPDAPTTALKPRSMAPEPSAALDHSNLGEAALRKLPRVELQKLAMAHKVKANTKSELIIQQLLRLQIPKRTRPAEDEPEEAPLRKRFKREVASEEVSILPTPKNPAALPNARSAPKAPVQTNVKKPHAPEAGPSAPRSRSPAHHAPTVLSYDQDLFSGTESEMTEEEQLDYATPVSSRAGTPPPAHVNDLRRCVAIMQEISEKDVALLNQVTEVRETAVKLRKRARDVRDLVKAEKGRRERMEAYFRYWQEIEPMWHREWLFGEKMVPDYKIQLEDLDEPAGPPTIPAHPHTQKGRHLKHAQPPALAPTRKPSLLPEQVKQKRDAIVSKQEAEQRELEALWIREVRGENSSREGSSTDEADALSPDESSSPVRLLTADENHAKEPLMIQFEQSVDSSTTIAVPAPSS